MALSSAIQFRTFQHYIVRLGLRPRPTPIFHRIQVCNNSNMSLTYIRTGQCYSHRSLCLMASLWRRISSNYFLRNYRKVKLTGNSATDSSRLYTTTPIDQDKKQSPDTVLVSLQRLEDSMRYHGYSTIRIGLAVFFVFGIAVYIFRESIRKNVADEVSQVASRSLKDQAVANKAEEFAKGLLNALLSDEKMHQLAAQFVMEVLDRNETKQSMSVLVLEVLQDPKTKAQLTDTLKQVIIAAMNEEDTRAALKLMAQLIIRDEETKTAVKNLIGNLFAEAQMKELTATFIRDVLRSEEIRDQAAQLGKEVTQSVISDPALQERTGDSLWAAMTYSITPRWLGSGSSLNTTDNVPTDLDDNIPTDVDEESFLGG